MNAALVDFARRTVTAVSAQSKSVVNKATVLVAIVIGTIMMAPTAAFAAPKKPKLPPVKCDAYNAVYNGTAGIVGQIRGLANLRFIIGIVILAVLCVVFIVPRLRRWAIQNGLWALLVGVIVGIALTVWGSVDSNATC